MKTYFGRRWAVITVLALITLTVSTAIPVAAQDVDLSETFTLDDGTTFQYPGDWKLENERRSLLNVSDDQTQLFIIDPVSLEDFGFSDDADLRDALTGYFEDIFAGQIKLDKKKLQDLEIDGREAVRYDYDDPTGDGALLIALRLSDGSIALIDSVSLDGELTEADIVLAIAATLDRSGEAGGPPSGGAAVATTPCTVTTDSNNVAVRVGPGTNRAPFVFLPSGMDFDVLGKSETSDGTVWWKLDKQAVAPKKSAAEAWVSELDVDESGDCDAVADVNAPPVIPISAPPASGGGNSGGGGNNGGGGQPAGSGEALPQSGTWTITYPKTVPGSCTNIPTQNLEVDFASETVTVGGANGSSLVFGGDVYPRIGANTYQGSYVTSEGDPVLLTLRVSSSTFMTGEFIISFTQDGAQCSITVTSSITHN